MLFKQLVALLKETYSRWLERQAPRLGASVAFYSILSFAPLLVLITALIALVFGHENAQASLINEAKQWIGDRGAETVQTLLRNAQQPSSGIFATVLAFITLLFGASGVFIELQDALNLMWDVSEQNASGLIGLIKQRLFSFGMILSIGFLLLIFLIISAGLAFLGHHFGNVVPMPPVILQVINFVTSFAAISGLFALMFKYVPAARISWKDVSVGAVGTALLFSIGKLLLGLYLGKTGLGSTYGAAGSLVAVVVWIYYSAQIFFFGAEFTRVYSDTRKGKREPARAGTPSQGACDAEAGRIEAYETGPVLTGRPP
ncbi:MAG TPA: YihY/virulence factor BrkB family protein [Edaphobacter sp.]|nr:YihY/virulence factor BrkB family protein [Edaphobacter sp.]